MDNYEKRDRYAYLSNKLKNALDNEFYYEAILLEYAIIDDRTSSLLRHSNFNLKNLKKNDVYRDKLCIPSYYLANCIFVAKK